MTVLAVALCQVEGGTRADRNAGASHDVRRSVRGRTSSWARVSGVSPVALWGHFVIRVLVADDQALLRGSFKVLVDSEPDLTVVGEAATGAEAVAVALEERPDVVLMDVRMPEMDGIEATRQIGDLARVLIVTMFDLDAYVYDALRAGASGFLLKDTPPADLVAAIRVVAAGEALLAPEGDAQADRGVRPHAGVATGQGASRSYGAGAGSSHPDRSGPFQQRDRRSSSPQPCHGQDPHQSAPGQARRSRPRTACHRGVRSRGLVSALR